MVSGQKPQGNAGYLNLIHASGSNAVSGWRDERPAKVSRGVAVFRQTPNRANRSDFPEAPGTICRAGFKALLGTRLLRPRYPLGGPLRSAILKPTRFETS